MARQVLTYPDIPPVLTQALGDARYSLTAHLHTGTYLPVSHEPGTDPHPQYLNTTRGDARYLQTATAATTYLPLVGGTLSGALRLDAGMNFAGDVTLARTSAGALKLDNFLGVRATPGAWRSDLAAIQYGTTAAVMCDTGGGIANYLLSNVMWGATRKAITNNPGAILQFDGTSGMLFLTAPAVAAGADQTFATRFTLNPAGNLGVGVTPAAWAAAFPAVQIGVGGAVWGNTGGPGLWLTSNTYYDGTARKQLVASQASTELAIGASGLSVLTSPAVAAGATQVQTTRLTLDQAGVLTVVADAASGGLRMQPAFSNQYWMSCEKSDGRMVYNTGATGMHQWAFGSFAAGTVKMALTSTGSLTVTPDAGSLQYAVVIASGGAVQWNETTNNYFARLQSGNTSQGSLEFVGVSSGAYFSPILAFHGAAALGQPAKAWSTVYAVTGTIQPSHIDTKEHIQPLDPAACVEAVLGTQWWEFDYKPAPLPEDATDEQRAEHEKYVEESAATRHQRGYVLGSSDHQTSDLFGMGDRKSASPQTDLAVVACALQQCLLEIAELKARLV